MKVGLVKKIFAGVLVTAMGFSVVACGGSSDSKTDASAKKNKLEEIKSSGKLVLGTSADYAPYEFHMNVDGKDTIVGFDIEIAKEIAKDLGVELEIQDMKFDTLTAALQAGTIDMAISGMNPTPERQEAVDFSDIYYKAEHGIIIKADKKDVYKTKDDFDGKSVGAQKGTIQQDLILEQMTKTTFKGLGKVPDLIMELKSGNSEAIVMEIPVADAIAKANPEFYVIQEPGFKLDETEQGSAIAMPKNSPELVEAVNKTLARLQKDGAIDKFIVEANELNNSK